MSRHPLQPRGPRTSAAPFAEWLRDELCLDLDRRLLCQSLCEDALEQLHARTPDEAPWSELNIAACVRYTSRVLPHLRLGQRELHEAAAQLLAWLAQAGLLDSDASLRLLDRAEPEAA